MGIMTARILRLPITLNVHELVACEIHESIHRKNVNDMSKTEKQPETPQILEHSVSKRCICCSVEIPPIDYSGGDTPWTGMWNGGIVDRIAANYGSILDGNIYVIAVCDSCIKQKESDGIVQYTSNYMH